MPDYDHQLTDDTTNDVLVYARKTDAGYVIACDCGNIVTVNENPNGKVLVCYLNEEDYWVEVNEEEFLEGLAD